MGPSGCDSRHSAAWPIFHALDRLAGRQQGLANFASEAELPRRGSFKVLRAAGQAGPPSAIRSCGQPDGLPAAASAADRRVGCPGRAVRCGPLGFQGVSSPRSDRAPRAVRPPDPARWRADAPHDRAPAVAPDGTAQRPGHHAGANARGCVQSRALWRPGTCRRRAAATAPAAHRSSAAGDRRSPSLRPARDRAGARLPGRTRAGRRRQRGRARPLEGIAERGSGRFQSSRSECPSVGRRCGSTMGTGSPRRPSNSWTSIRMAVSSASFMTTPAEHDCSNEPDGGSGPSPAAPRKTNSCRSPRIWRVQTSPPATGLGRRDIAGYR